MDKYALAVYEPEDFDPSWVVAYYCCYKVGHTDNPSESFWAVPGTLEY